MDGDTDVDKVGDLVDGEGGSREREISTYDPLGRASGRTVCPRFMENHNFGFGGDGQSIVLTPRLGGLHHGQELGNG